MLEKEYKKLFIQLSIKNKFKLAIFILLTLIYKYTKAHIIRKIKIKIIDIEYELTVGMGELKTIIHTNLLQDYFQIDGFKPKNSAVCVDVGANIGSTSLMWAQTLADGKIFALEPHPNTFALLNRNIEINSARNKIIPKRIAVGASDGEMLLFVSNEGTMAMKPDQRKWTGKSIYIPSVSLDSFFEQEKISTVDILKIDIEGFEDDALEGAEKTLRHTKKVVLEYHSSELREKCLSILKSHGFKTEEKDSLIFGWRE